MASFTRKEPIHWCTSKTPGTNPMKLKKKVIGPAGQVVELSLATGKTITSIIGNSYKDLIEFEKRGRGFVDYAECPCEHDKCAPVRTAEEQTQEELAELCESCAARETLIRTRTAAKGRTNSEYAAMFESNLDKLAKVLEQSMAGSVAPKLSDEQLAAAMATPVKTAKPRRQVK